jgi:hypothetical protein
MGRKTRLFSFPQHSFRSVPILHYPALSETINQLYQTVGIFRIRRKRPQNRKVRWTLNEQTIGLFHSIQLKGVQMNNTRNEIKAQIIRAGFTMQEVCDRLHDDYGWSDSVSNLSNKLQRESIRFREVVELADVLGYDIVWQKRRDR